MTNLILSQGEIEQLEQQARDDVEEALRHLIGRRHAAACQARLLRERPEVIRRLDLLYEGSLVTYRNVIGREPTAA